MKEVHVKKLNKRGGLLGKRRNKRVALKHTTRVQGIRSITKLLQACIHELHKPVPEVFPGLEQEREQQV